MQCVDNCDSPNKSKRKHFEQPVLQTLQMFIGEMGCWLVVGAFSLYRVVSAKYSDASSTDGERAPLIAPPRDDEDPSPTPPIANPLKPTHDPEERIPLVGWKILLLALPACCDITGTTLMNVGLLFVAASIYQMTRGALVLFVGLFSVLFLKRRLSAYKWIALFIVVAGVAVVGLAGAISKDDKATPSSVDLHLVRSLMASVKREVKSAATPAAVRTIVGILLIAAAQIFTASQFVLEESIMEKYAMEPIKVVGWEGIFGFSVTLIVMIVLHFAVGRTDAGRGGYFDAAEGWYQWTHYRPIAVSSFLIMISIG